MAWSNVELLREVNALQWELFNLVAEGLGCTVCRKECRLCDHSTAWDQATRDALTRSLWSVGQDRLDALMRDALRNGWLPREASEIPCPECGVGPLLPCAGPWPEEGAWDERHKARDRAWVAWVKPAVGQVTLASFG